MTDSHESGDVQVPELEPAQRPDASAPLLAAAALTVPGTPRGVNRCAGAGTSKGPVHGREKERTR